jgi:ribonucleotide monophosphatase NagD (HAD superfamily)
VRGILLDLDGVLYVGDQALPGAADVVAWLRRHEVPHLFVTNTTSRPRDAIVDKLAGFGVEARADQILTPAVAAVAWLRESAPGRPALFVPDETAAEFAGLGPLPADADQGASSVVAPDGLRLDAGAFVRALEYATGTTAVVVGKPDPGFYALAVGILGVPAADAAMIGDDIRADVEGAQRAGLCGVLVRTGKFSDADLDSDVTPQAVLDSVADLPGWLSEQLAP